MVTVNLHLIIIVLLLNKLLNMLQARRHTEGSYSVSLKMYTNAKWYIFLFVDNFAFALLQWSLVNILHCILMSIKNRVHSSPLRMNFAFEAGRFVIGIVALFKLGLISLNMAECIRVNSKVNYLTNEYFIPCHWFVRFDLVRAMMWVCWF